MIILERRDRTARSGRLLSGTPQGVARRYLGLPLKPRVLGGLLLMGAVACGPRVSVGDLGGGGGGRRGGDPLGGSPGVAGAVGGTGGDVIEGEGIAGGDAGSDAVGGRADPGYGSPCPVQAQGGADAGATRVDWTDPTAAPDCGAEPVSYQDYGSQAELEALMVGRWRRCKSRQLDGEDAGVEFTVDGHYYPLTFNAEHQIVRCIGVDYEEDVEGGVVAALEKRPTNDEFGATSTRHHRDLPVQGIHASP
jgi:hypothetical protein